MFIALDVHYRVDHAKAVALLFKDWTSTEAQALHSKDIAEVQAYVPGAFYQRELPCLLEVLGMLPVDEIDCLIVDGFVFLSKDRKPGLGYYLYQALDQAIPIIGVAKSSFKNASDFALPILRGESQQPLYVTSVGIDIEQAAENIRKMVGSYRMPDLLRQLDQETKA